MPADLERMACGCVHDTDLGIAVSFCKAHDRRTRQVKLGAALADLALWLEQAGGLANGPDKDDALRQAAKAALKASKAVMAPDPNEE